MRYDLSDFEWSVIEPLFPNKPSTGSLNRLLSSDRSPTAPSSELPIPIAKPQNWSERNTQFKKY